jgi:O-antigen ligase
VTAAIFVSRGRSGIPLLAGVLAGITLASAYGLATRLFPERMGSYDPVQGNRLAEPLGYANALGVFAVMGSLLAAGVAVRARRPVVRALSAASLVILVPTLYFTFSRGAWVALAAGLAATIAVDRRRLQFAAGLLVVAPPSAIAVWLASRSTALTNEQPVFAEVSRDGRRFALAVVVLAAISALAALAFFYAEARIQVGRRLRWSFALFLAAVLVAGLASVFVAYGTPATLARKAYEGFKAPPVPVTDLNDRLFQLSGKTRAEYWAAAWDDFEAHPALGSGAGSYEQYWLRSRSNGAEDVRDAHGLYLETLAELGPVGLGLLLAALAVPIAAAVRARKAPLVPTASGAYVAYLVHAGVDWDWEMMSVTAAALLCGVALLVWARGTGTRTLSAATRAGVLAAALALTAFSFVGLVGNSALAAGYDAFAAGRDDEAEAEARKAAKWAPWSPEPWQLLGEVQLAKGDSPLARANFRKAIAKDERNWELWFGLAEASAGDERKRAFARAVSLNPWSIELAEFERVELAGGGA